MKKLIVCLMALSLVAFYSCKKEEVEPDGNTNTPTNNGGNNGGNNNQDPDDPNNPGGNTNQSVADMFAGTWNITADASNAHMTAQILSGYVGNIDTTMNLNGVPLVMTITKVSETQVTLAGSIEVLDGFVLDFNTTGTITDAGMTVEPVDISGTTDVPIPDGIIPEQYQSIAGMLLNDDGTITINYTGTFIINNPVAIPQDGVMNFTASLTAEGSDPGMYSYHMITFNLNAPTIECISVSAKCVKNHSNVSFAQLFFQALRRR